MDACGGQLNCLMLVSDGSSASLKPSEALIHHQEQTGEDLKKIIVKLIVIRGAVAHSAMGENDVGFAHPQAVQN